MKANKFLACIAGFFGCAIQSVYAGGPIYTGESVRIYGINAGGAAYANWEADKYFTGGGTATNTSVVTNTSDTKLYQSERLGNSTYHFPVPNGDYIVVLHFAETYFNAPMKRVFDVNVEDVKVLDQLDIFSRVGKNAMIEEYFDVKGVSDGDLKIEFKNATRDQPTISGIEIFSTQKNKLVPGVIQAENYEEGGAGIGYADSTPGNSGGVFRKDAVDIEPTLDTGKGFDVGWLTNGEWMSYAITVYNSANYKFTARVASAASGTKTFHIEVDGVNVSGPISFTTNQGWQTFTDVVFDNIVLAPSTKRFKFVVDQGGFNINYFKIETSAQDVLVKNIKFTDPAFSNCVNNSATSNGWVRAVDVQSVECLGMNIRSIDGIEFLTNINRLVMGYNHLVTADLSHNPKLTWVTMEHNQTLSYIDVTHSPLLTTMDLWGNSLTSINLNNNPVLSWLSVGANPLTPEAKAYIRSLLQIKDLQIDP